MTIRHPPDLLFRASAGKEDWSSRDAPTEALVTSASIAPERQHRTTAEADATLRHIGMTGAALVD